MTRASEGFRFRHSGFTLIELLLVIAIVSLLSDIVLTAANPRKNIVSARDSERLFYIKQYETALTARVVDGWTVPTNIPIPECTGDYLTCALPICRYSAVECGVGPGVSLDNLFPTYIASLPMDAVMEKNANCTGYMIYQKQGRFTVFNPNMGKSGSEEPEPESTCGTGGPMVPAPSDYVAYWKFDDGAGTTAADSVGTNHGALTNMILPGAWVTDTAPVEFANTHALDFDGTNDYVNAGSASAIDNLFTGGGTISAWFRVDGWGYGNTRALLLNKMNISSGNGYVLYVNNSCSCFIYRHAFSGRSASWQTPNGSITIGQWYGVSVAYNSDSVNNIPVILINGILQELTTTSAPLGTSVSDASSDFTIGKSFLVNSFSSIIDDVRLYDRSMSELEQQAVTLGR